MKAFDYNNYDFIVSIDFGTTYSGSCFIPIRTKIAAEAILTGNYSKLKNEIKNITKWGSANVTKVPTVAIYSKKTKHLLEWGSEAYRTWQGVDKKEDFERFSKETITLRKFKLKLKRDEENEEEGITVSDPKFEYLYLTATIDYLRNINETAFNQIKSQTIHTANVDKAQFRYILTVPAEWTEDERTAMRVMAKEAGIISKDDHENRLLIINESYAATLFCEKEIHTATQEYIFNLENDEHAKFPYKEGCRYLVCDAGGGTVDLATYESTQPFTEDDIEKRVLGRCQLTTDSGKKCGSGYVDDRMESLLIDILFYDVENMSIEEKKSAVARFMVEFIDKIKINFNGEDSSDSESDTVSDPDDSDSDDSDDFDEFEKYGVDNDMNNESSKSCNEGGTDNEDEKGDIEFDFQDMLKIDKDRINLQPTPKGQKPIYRIEPNAQGGYSMLKIRKDIVCERVFDPVVNQTIALIENQIKKANSPNIDATFLLGGFGKSLYLKKKIEEYFTDNQAGEIINSIGFDSGGETAAMRGAIYYGLDGLRSSQITSIKNVYFKDRYFDPDYYDILLCFDIGYDFSKCGYFFLKESGNSDVNRKLIDYKDIKWVELAALDQFRPGRNEDEPHKIPTVLEYIGDEDDESREVLWGAEVNPNSKNKIEMSRLLSINKDEFYEFYQDYLTQIYQYACNYLRVLNPRHFNRDKIRYCLTMESCYDLSSSRDEMREIARDASLICDGDNPKRLLLINREDASSILYEDIRYINDENVNSYSWNITLHGESNYGYLTLYEVKPYTQKESNRLTENAYSKRVEDEVKEPKLLTEEPIRFDFNFLSILAENIYSYPEALEGDDSIYKKAIETNGEFCVNSTHTGDCVESLKKNLNNFFAKNPNINDHTSETKHVINADCCSVLFTVQSFVKFIVKPSVRELANIILNKISEATISTSYTQIDHLNVTGDIMSGMPIFEVEPEKLKQSRLADQNDIGTILKVCLYKSDLSIIKYFEDISIINKKPSLPHKNSSEKASLISQASTDSILKMQGKDVVDKKKKAYLNHFLQIQILRNCVYLTLHEATTINGKAYCNANRNIRRLRSTTLGFDFVRSLARYLHRYVINQEEKDNNACTIHPKESKDYQEALLHGLLNYMKHHIDLEDNNNFEGRTNQIQHPCGDCCSFKLSPHEFITQILKPTIRDVIDEIYTHILQADMTRQYTLDNIIILGGFIDGTKELNELVKEIIFEKLLDLGLCGEIKDIIDLTESEGNEVIYGAAIHGLDPTIHTQRISRRAYGVSVNAYNNIDEKRPVTLYYQPSSGSSRTERITADVMPLVLINKNDKVTPEMQTIGTFKRFFADEDCIVYATIHATEDELHDKNYKKIHQFEVFLNREHNHSNTYTNIRSRLNFEIRMIFPNNNETRFEANIMGSTKEIPEFRFRDQILVTNFYD